MIIRTPPVPLPIGLSKPAFICSKVTAEETAPDDRRADTVAELEFDYERFLPRTLSISVLYIRFSVLAELAIFTVAIETADEV